MDLNAVYLLVGLGAGFVIGYFVCWLQLSASEHQA